MAYVDSIIILSSSVEEGAIFLRGVIDVLGEANVTLRGFMVIANPLTDLIEKNDISVWGAKRTEVFNILKKCLLSTPVLSVHSPGTESEVHTGAIEIGLGAFLLLKQNKL